MKLVARCPQCMRVVDMADRVCVHCGFRLTRPKFRLTSVLAYGSLGVLLAMVVALLIVPVVVICAVVALFARDKNHVVRFEDHGGDDGLSA